MAVTPAKRGRNPHSTEGVVRGEDGIARYAQRPSSLVHMLQATVERDPDATALVDVGGPTLSWGELWQRAVRIAGGLRANGVARGDRVTIRLPNGTDWVLAFSGAQIAGAVTVPVNTRFKAAEVDFVRKDSGTVYGFEPGEPLPDGEPLITADLRPGELTAIFYTSGTTGFPKGAMTSHANFLANVESAIRCVGLGRDEGPSLATVINVPLFHVTGANSQLLVMTELGRRTFVLANPLDLEGFLTTVSEEGIQMLTSVPAIYHALTRHPKFADTNLDHVRWVTDLVPALRGGVRARRQRSALRCRSPTSRSISPTQRPTSASCWCAARTSCSGTGTSPRRARRRSSTGGCAPAISGGSTQTACSTSWTGPRT